MEKLSLVSGAVSLTGNCTIACKHCYSESGPAVKAYLSTSQLIAIIDELKTRGVRQVFLGGGEPFLHQGLEQLVKHMLDQGVLPSISSNGHAFTHDRLNALYECGLRYNLSISLDGPTEEINQVVRGKNSFLRTLLGMYQLSEFGKILWGVNYVSCKSNLGYAKETAELASRLGASYFNCIKFTPSGRGERYIEELLINDAEFMSEINALSSSYVPFGEYYQDIYVFDIRVGSSEPTAKTMAKCARSYFSDFLMTNPLGVSINHNGDVALAPPNIPLGNIHKESFDVILDNLENSKVQEQYNLWLEGNWNGIHPPRSASRGMPEVSLVTL